MNCGWSAKGGRTVRRTEFLALKQGNNSVIQYAQNFNTLSQYAGYHVDTDEKKQACFRQGLSSKLQDRLAMFKFDTFSELVNGAIVQKDAHLSHKAEKKRKAPAAGTSSSNPQRFRIVQSGPQRAPPVGVQATKAAVGVSATPVHIASGDGQTSCSTAERAEGLGAAAGGAPPICSLVTTVGNRDTSPVIAQCHQSKASSRASRTRSSKLLTSSRGRCTTPPLRVFLRELQ